MMDDEVKIRQLEEQLRHEKTMRKLQADRLDTHDQSFDHVISGFDAIQRNLEEIVQVQKQFAVDQAKTDSMLRDLIAALTKTGGNGKH
jgi:predicted transcriptional regulator